MIKEHYDVVVIGSGPGGSSLAWKLAQTGKSVLVIERGDYLKRERENWDTDEVFAKGRYQVEETWTSSAGDTFRPGLHYFVGGNSKVYGAALFRLREEDFFAVQHADGLSPEWPLKYDVFEPYYQAAEELYEVRGQRGEDPTEPAASGPYKHRPIKHEPRIQQLADDWAREGLQPFHLPIGGLIDQDEAGAATPHSRLLRCDPFDGYPSLTNGKADAQIICLDPALQQWPNLQLLRNAYVSRLLTNATGNSIAGVETLIEGRTHIIRGDLVVVACGALSSALLFLRSANEHHPDGLANRSGLVGRNYMRHHNSTVLAISRSPNPTEFQKTLGLNDFYHAHPKSPRNPHDFPLGHIQMVGKSDGRQIQTEGLPSFLHWLPDQPFEWIARHSIDFWLTSEDLPRPENRIFYRDGQVHLDVQTAHTGAHLALRDMLRQICDKADIHPHLMDRRLYLGKDTPISGTAHQAGTLKFGEDPRATVLDLDCRTHEVDNLYVTDASFFPSVGAVNPTLTIIANSLRVADAIIARLG
ncbi:dehydrogenase [Pseudomonas oryzihabitans]|nr:dehydrogenase [Pseudomonas psychrotolerans]